MAVMHTTRGLTGVRRWGYAAALLSLLLMAVLRAAAGETLPLDPQDSALTFMGESFLHDFHGEAKDFSGEAHLKAEAVPPIQNATLHFRMAAITTFQSQRDQRMWDWLQIKAHPDATFHLKAVRIVAGNYKTASSAEPAKFLVSGSFTLNGVEVPLSATVQGWRNKDRVILQGETNVDTLKHDLPQIREAAVLTVGTEVKIAFRFSFVLPPDRAVK